MSGGYNITLQCSCTADILIVQNADPQAWKDDAADGGHVLTCWSCGKVWQTVDDTEGDGITTQEIP